MSQEINCVIQVILLGLVLLFWALSSRRFGSEVDTSLHPMRGGSGALVHIFFGAITLILIAIALAMSFR